MRFEWDQRKNEANIEKHGLDFHDAHSIFGLPMLVGIDDRGDYGEDRWIGVGLLDGRVVVVVFSESQDETVRIISLRKALSHESKRYENYLKNELGAC